MLFLNNLNHGAWYQDVTGNHINACDLSGFKAKPNELIKQWNGLYVLPEFAEEEHPADNMRVRQEAIGRGSIRPEPTEGFNFITETVSPEDY